MMRYPDTKLGDLDITQYPLISGFYTLGWLQQTRQDCQFVTHADWQNYHDYDWLNEIIVKSLTQGKKVCILPWDEDVLAYNNESLQKVLNQYTTESVFWIHQLPYEKQEIYSYHNGIECKMLSLPWWLLNEAITYYKLYNLIKQGQKPLPTNYQYLCMVSNYSAHKYELIKALHEKKLHDVGLITVKKYKDYPEYIQSFVKENKQSPFKNLSPLNPAWSGQVFLNNCWVSGTAQNILHIEQTYDMPLIINAETTNGIFFSSEKSLWPMLLGKMYLLWGAPYTMSWIQQFHDISQLDWANTTFDNVGLNYTKKCHADRLEALLEYNTYTIRNARDIYNKLSPRLEAARWTIGNNLYKYCCKQLEKII